MFDGKRPQDLLRHRRDERLHRFHHRRVIAERAVGFEHREFGIVPAREAFVAEVFPDLKQLVYAADEQPLVVKLQRNAQIKFAAERIVKGLERLRRRAAGNRLHRRRLDLDVVAFVEKIPDFVDDRAALEHHVLHVWICNQIKVALAVADLGVFEAVIFRGRRAQRFGENDEAGELHGNLAGLGREHRPLHADEIAEVEMLENLELFVAENILLRVSLEPPALVADVNEHGLAHVAMRRDAAGQRRFAAFDVIFSRGIAGFRRRKFILERVNALRAQGDELGLALFDQ